MGADNSKQHPVIAWPTSSRYLQVYTGKLRDFLADGAEDPESLAYRQLEELILAQVSEAARAETARLETHVIDAE